ELRNRSGTEDVERRMIKRYSPIVWRAARKIYLLRACCCVSCAFHVLSPLRFPYAFADPAEAMISPSSALGWPDHLDVLASETLDDSLSLFVKCSSMSARTPLCLHRSFRGYPPE